MGVSFKVSRTGTRFRPKALSLSETSVDEVSGKESSRIAPRNEPSTEKLEGGGIEVRDNVARASCSSKSSEENEVSFTLNLFSDGYSIGKPTENSTAHQATLQDVPKDLHPYDRRSETFFSAIESGRLPGDILDDIPCKFLDGTLVCEVRDYRKYTTEQGSNAPSTHESPIVNKICLKMSLENVVKDIPLISDNSWTYGDLMEVESRILNALQPQLCLDPTPKLDRLSNAPVPMKLNLAQCSMRMKRLRQMAEVTVTSNSKSHGKKICIDRVPESSNSRLGDSGVVSGNIIPQHVQDNLTVQNHGSSGMPGLRPRSLVPDSSAPALPMSSQQVKYHTGVGNQRSLQDHGLGSVNVSGASPASQDMIISYSDNMNSNAHLQGKRDNPDGPLSPLSTFSKRSRLTPLGADGISQQQMGSHIDGLHGSDLNWRNTLLQQQQAMTRGIQFGNTGIQKYSQQVLHGVLNQDAASTPFSAGQQGMRFVPKEEQFDGESKNDMQMMGAEMNHLDPQQSRLQQRLPQHPYMRSGFSQNAWNNLGQHVDKDLRKEDLVQKRKPVQSPRLSTGALAQSPLSSKSGEFSSGSVAPQYGGVTNSMSLGSQKDKAAVTSVPGGTQSLTSSANDSLQRQHQAQAAVKRRSNSLPKTPAISGVGSPVSVSNMSVPLNANSPSIGTPPLVDQTMLEKFSKIDMVTMRHQLNCKKNKVDNFPVKKPNNYPAQQLLTCLSNISNNEDVKDDTRPLSKSLVGGSMNVCKSRVLNFVQPERVVQGNMVSIVPKARTRMVMSEKLNGTVVMYYGDLKDEDFLEIEDYLPTLPNNHLADLLTAQFCHLMTREGYLLEDHIQHKPTRISQAPIGLSNVPGMSHNNPTVEMQQQYAESVSGHQSNEGPKPTNSGNASINSSQNLQANVRMPPPVNSQAVQMSPGVSMPPRTQQLDQQQQQPSLQQHQQQNQQSLLQQQHPQFQRSPMMLASNQLSHLNAQGSSMQLGNHMVNKPSPLQLQLLQQQQQQQQALPQQQQQQQMQRKMMMGLGTAVGMGNMGNNMIGLGGLGNAMGMGGARGMGGAGISAPMGGTIGQTQINLSQASNISNVISQQLRSGALTPQQAALMQSKLRMVQNRGNILGATQAGLAGMSGARQMQQPGSTGLSMLGQTLNRGNMNPMQRTMMSPMGPPKLMAGMNPYMNQQQQLQQQQQQQPMQQQQQLQLQQQQQQQQLQLQQQQMQQQQLQQQPQQQETTSPLQAVVSPPQVGSPPTMGTPQLNPQPQQQQQQSSPQQMNQRTPMSPQQMNQRTPLSPQQMSSGAIHATMSAGNPETCPASPQLSSQTLGSVGSITNSPMDLQGVTKSNSVSNA